MNGISLFMLTQRAGQLAPIITCKGAALAPGIVKSH
jgi:hypothetical protein